MDNQTYIRQLFQRYLDDEVSKEEVIELVAYLKDQRNEQLFSELIYNGLDVKRLADANGLSPEQKDNIAYVRRALDDLISQNPDAIGAREGGVRTFSRRFMHYAAVLALFVVSALSALYYFRKDGVPDHKEEIVVTTQVGERKRIVLPDGSRVHLNHLSSIRYPRSFSRDKREVVMFGEASFDVRRDSQRPFSVSSLDLETKVLGTNFIVKAYDNDSYIAVSVLEGKVAVHDGQDAHEPLVLSGNERVLYDRKIKEMGHVQQMKPGAFGAWEQGIIRLRDMSFEEAIRVLERIYNIKIAFSDDLRDCPIYADINEQDSVGKVLSLLALSINGTYSQVDSAMWEVSGRGCTR